MRVDQKVLFVNYALVRSGRRKEIHIDNMKSGVWVININIHPAGGLTLSKMSWEKNWKPLCAKNSPFPADNMDK